jgi:hypothetical protein
MSQSRAFVSPYFRATMDRFVATNTQHNVSAAAGYLKFCQQEAALVQRESTRLVDTYKLSDQAVHDKLRLTFAKRYRFLNKIHKKSRRYGPLVFMGQDQDQVQQQQQPDEEIYF